MQSSQSPSEPAAGSKPAPYCAFPNCKVPPTKFCSRCKETQYCSKEHQTEHWRWHKKICVAPDKKPPPPGPPATYVPLKGSVEDDEDTYIICLVNVVNAKLRPCGHSATCRECTQGLITQSEPSPLCRKNIAGFDVGKWQSSIGEHGLRKLETFEACLELGRACSFVGDGDDTRRYYKQAKDGYEEQLGPNGVKTLEATGNLVMAGYGVSNDQERIEQLRDVLKRVREGVGRGECCNFADAQLTWYYAEWEWRA